jgi:hypothetical protein
MAVVLCDRSTANTVPTQTNTVTWTQARPRRPTNVQKGQELTVNRNRSQGVILHGIGRYLSRRFTEVGESNAVSI